MRPAFYSTCLALILSSCTQRLTREEKEVNNSYCRTDFVTQEPLAIDSAEMVATIEFVRGVLGDKSGLSMVLFDKQRILLEHHTGYRNAQKKLTVDAETSFYIASSTKSLIATAVLQLAEKGHLDLDAPIKRYLPELHFDSWLLIESKITLRDLLTHQPGISSKPLEIRTSITGEYDDQTILSLYQKADGSFLGARYSNLHYILIGMILERVTGLPWQYFIEKKITEPLGLTRTFTYWPDEELENVAVPHTMDSLRNIYPVAQKCNPLRNNTLFPSGGVITSARDLARYVQLYLNCGKIDGVPYLSATTIHDATVPYTKSKGGLHNYFGFGMGWEIGRHDSLTIVAHEGSNIVGSKSYMAFSPVLGIGLVILSNENIIPHYVHGALARYVWDRLRDPDAATANLKINLERWKLLLVDRFNGRMEGRSYGLFNYPDMEFPEPALRTFTGEYYNKDFGTVIVTVQAEQLNVKYGNLNTINVKRIYPDTFVGDNGVNSEIFEFNMENNSAIAIEFKYMDIVFKKVE